MALTSEELNKKIKNLPQDIQDAFFSDDVSAAILNIGKKYGLAIDKIGELGDETSNVMFGISTTADFIKNLSERLGVDREKAKVIAEEINQKVFQPIKVSLRKVHGLPAEMPAAVQANKPVEIKTPAVPIPAPPTSTITSSPYVIPTKQPIAPPAVPAKSVTVGDTKLDFAPIPAKKIEIKPSSGASATPPIFAKKITPIDTLLDKIDAGDGAPKPKPKLDSSSLQLNPPPASSGIRTMFQDAKTFLQGNKSAPIPAPAPSVVPPVITMPKQEKFNTVPPPPKPVDAPPNLPVEAKPIPPIAPPKQDPTGGLKQDAVKAEIENALGGKIKIGDNSIKDPYKEPID